MWFGLRKKKKFVSTNSCKSRECFLPSTSTEIEVIFGSSSRRTRIKISKSSVVRNRNGWFDGSSLQNILTGSHYVNWQSIKHHCYAKPSLTCGYKLVQFNHKETLVLELKTCASFVSLWGEENSNHTESLCTRVIIHLYWNGVWNMLQVGEPLCTNGWIKKSLRDKNLKSPRKAYLAKTSPRGTKSIPSQWKKMRNCYNNHNCQKLSVVFTFWQIQIALLPVSIYDVWPAALGLDLNCTDADARVAQLISRIGL